MALPKHMWYAIVTTLFLTNLTCRMVDPTKSAYSLPMRVCGVVLHSTTQEPIANASITWDTLSQPILTNSMGQFCLTLLSGDPVLIQAKKNGYKQLVRLFDAQTAAETGTVPYILFMVPETCYISGTCRDSSIPGASNNGIKGVTLSLKDNSIAPVATTTSNTNGEFCFSWHIKDSARMYISAAHPDFRPVACTLLTKPGDSQLVQLVASPRKKIAGRMLWQDLQEPISGAVLESSTARDTTGSNGYFLLSGIEPENGKVFVEVSGPTCVPQQYTFEVLPFGVDSFDIAIRDSLWVTGLVLDAESRDPLDSVYVTTPFAHSLTTISQNGVFGLVLSFVPDTGNLFTFKKNGYVPLQVNESFECRTFFSDTILLEPQRGDLTVRVVLEGKTSSAGARISLEGFAPNEVSGPTGVVTLTGVRAGTHTLWVRHPDFHTFSAPVTITPGSTTELGLCTLTIKKGTIEETVRWENDEMPIIIEDTLTVARDAVLVIGPNMQIELRPPALLRIKGTLQVEGTSDQYATLSTQSYKGPHLFSAGPLNGRISFLHAVCINVQFEVSPATEALYSQFIYDTKQSQLPLVSISDGTDTARFDHCDFIFLQSANNQIAFTPVHTPATAVFTNSIFYAAGPTVCEPWFSVNGNQKAYIRIQASNFYSGCSTAPPLTLTAILDTNLVYSLDPRYQSPETFDFRLGSESTLHTRSISGHALGAFATGTPPGGRQ